MSDRTDRTGSLEQVLRGETITGWDIVDSHNHLGP